MGVLKLVFYITFIIVIAFIAIRIYRKKEKLELKGFYLALIALIISIIPFVETIFNLIPQKNIDIISITPVCVYREFDRVKITPLPYELGCYLILEIRNHNKDSYISSFQINGNLRVKEMDYIVLHSNVGKKIDSILIEYKERKPFYKIAWSTWPYRNNYPLKVEANSQQYIILTLWDPILNGQREDGWRVPLEDYFGYKNDNIMPKRANAFPSAQDFFEMSGQYNIQGINNNIKDKEIKFVINVNGKIEKYDSGLLKEPIIIDNESWEKQPLEKILLREDKLIN